MTQQNGYWPDGARLAMSVSMQFEAGGQPARSGAGGPIAERSCRATRIGAEHLHEYGARQGVPRNLDLLDASTFPASTRLPTSSSWPTSSTSCTPRALLDRITTSSEFVDVLREVFGELGTSHAFAYAPDRGTPAAGPGLLGADIERSGDVCC